MPVWQEKLGTSEGELCWKTRLLKRRGELKTYALLLFLGLMHSRGKADFQVALQAAVGFSRVRHLEYMNRAHLDALTAGVTELEIDVDQIDFVVSAGFGH